MPPNDGRYLRVKLLLIVPKFSRRSLLGFTVRFSAPWIEFPLDIVSRVLFREVLEIF